MLRLMCFIVALLISGALGAELHGDLRKLQSGPQLGGGSDTSLRAEKISDAALSTHEAILKATNRGSTQRATGVGAMMTAAAADSSVSHAHTHNLDEGGRHLLSGPSIAGGANAAELRSEKLSDAALGTQEAIMKASSRGSIQRATTVGAMMTAGATDRSVSHGEQHALEEGGRRLMGDGYRDDVGAMDGALAASAAITKAVNTPNKGFAQYATTKGSKAARTVTTPQTRFNMDHMPDEPLRRLLSGPGIAGGANGLELRSEKLSDAALGTQEAIMKASSRGSVTRATTVGSMMTAAATDASMGHSNMHNAETRLGDRHLLSGPGIAGGANGLELRSEKLSDAALSTQEAIMKASSRGSIQRATTVGAMMTAGATDRSVSHGAQHALEAGNRRLMGDGYRDDVGAMDGALAASAAITKAVNTPNKGFAQYATTKGSKAARTVTTPQTRFNMDHMPDEPLRRLLSGPGIAGGANGLELRAEKLSDAALGTQEAIMKATSRGSVTRATTVGSMMTAAATDASMGHSNMHNAETRLGGRRLLSNPGIAGGANSAELRSEKLSDAALGTQEAIMRASSRGSIQRATTVGARMAAGATDQSVSHGEQHALEEGGRRLMDNGIRDDMGAMDGALAASAAITKAVNTPNKGFAQYATTKGSKAARTVTTPQTRFNMDHFPDEPLRRLTHYRPRRLLQS